MELFRKEQNVPITFAKTASIGIQAWLTAALVIAGTLTLRVSPAIADGTTQTGTPAAMRATTVVRIDVLTANEKIRWSTNTAITLAISDPLDTTQIAVLSNGMSTAALPVGTYFARISANFAPGGSDSWAIDVLDGTTLKPGRVWSAAWGFNSNTFSAPTAQNVSFFAVAPGGAPNRTAVMEMKFVGLQGFVYDVIANQTGSVSTPGKSVPNAIVATEVPSISRVPLYLSEPENATYDPITATVAQAVFQGVPGNDCPIVATGSPGLFKFNIDVVGGTYQVICDINRDGIFDPASSADLLLGGATTSPTTTVAWNGTLNGVPVPPDLYDCQIKVNVGEFHFMGFDIETAYRGLRMYNLGPGAVRLRTPLNMFWDDTAVLAGGDVAMPAPTNVVGPTTSQIGGLNSGPYSDGAVAASTPSTSGQNARAWGNFTGTSRGNNNLLDTYAIATSSAPVQIAVEAINGGQDSDGDGLSDIDELCRCGSDPTKVDSDNGGLTDFEECAVGGNSSNPLDDRRCGDGIRVSGEACDDGNTMSNDGCNAACVIEPGYSCVDQMVPRVAPDVCTTRCGDGARGGLEGCDDGNLTAGDGCNSTCIVEQGFQCLDPAASQNDPDVCTAICGDGIRAAGETCDDGNVINGDGCSLVCVVEVGFTCTDPSRELPDVCVTTCGDGIRAGLEQCDDLNMTPGDGCTACTIDDGYSCVDPMSPAAAPDVCAPGCGDGIRAGGEACDDANLTDSDGCSSTCRIEPGFTCLDPVMPNRLPDVCMSSCGDGIRASNESCDDGNLSSADGCSAQCVTEPGFQCEDSIATPATPDMCAAARCGDGYRVGAETCDDGNVSDGDGCSAMCRVEEGNICDDPAPADPDQCRTKDRDNDTILDSEDNCPDTFNTDQLDADADGAGDACDTDDDNNGFNDNFGVSGGRACSAGGSASSGVVLMIALALVLGRRRRHAVR